MIASKLALTGLFLVAAAAQSACVGPITEKKIPSDFQIACPTGLVVSNVVYASYGLVTGDCDQGFERDDCNSEDSQLKSDRNVEFMLQSLCVGVNSCGLQKSWNGKDTANDFFGDSCVGYTKSLAVIVNCSEPTPPPALPTEDKLLWSTSQNLNLKNFNSHKELLNVLYSIARSADVDTTIKSFKDLQLQLYPNPNQFIPFSWSPLITFEKIFNFALFGYTTAWFGIVAKLPIDGHIVISYRGTLTPTEWLYDADFSSVALPAEMKYAADPNVRVHQGFLNLYKGMRPLLMLAVQILNPKQIHISGHSLGSALATLAAFDLANNGYNINSVYTFASPRVGNPAFAQAFNQLLAKTSSSHYRIANSADIVTQLPHPVLADENAGIDKYMHTGKMAHTFEYIPSTEETILSFTRGQFLGWAHSLDTYQKYAPEFLDFEDRMVE